MDFRKTMELIAAYCKGHKYCYDDVFKCPLLSPRDDVAQYCLLTAPSPEDVDRICEATEEIAFARSWERKEEE